MKEEAIFIFLTLFFIHSKEKGSCKKLFSEINQMYPGLIENALSRARSLKKFVPRIQLNQEFIFLYLKFYPRFVYLPIKFIIGLKI